MTWVSKFTDPFEAASNTNLSTRPDWQYYQDAVATLWSIRSATQDCRPQAGAATTHRIVCNFDLESLNQYAEGPVAGTNNRDIGFILRTNFADPDREGYTVQYMGGGDRVRIVRRVGGSNVTLLDEEPLNLVGEQFTLRAEVEGIDPVVIRAFIDDVEVASFNDTSGLRIVNTDNRYFGMTGSGANDQWIASVEAGVTDDPPQPQLLLPDDDAATGNWVRSPSGGSLASAIADQSDLQVALLDLDDTPSDMCCVFTGVVGVPASDVRTFTVRMGQFGSGGRVIARVREGSCSGTVLGTIDKTFDEEGLQTFQIQFDAPSSWDNPLHLHIEGRTS